VDQRQDVQFQAGLNFLKDSGFHILDPLSLAPRSAQEKAQDLMRVFADKNVKAVIASQGGNSTEEILAHIDWEIIRDNPKIFMGISDITVLLNAIYHKTGLVTFHGNDIKWGFGRNLHQYDKDEFKGRLLNASIGQIPANGPRRCVRPGRAEGKLLGGNLRCLLKLKDTEYWPNFEDSILLLEAFELTPETCSKFFKQLDATGVFRKVRGIIVGYIYGMQALHPKLPQLEDLISEYTAATSFPILKVNDFGHNCPNTVLPIGGTVAFDAQQCTVSIVEPCVI
jgi:muramoyltetrapeptide carboxypeptidase